ncbi:uncharacterized protein LOC109503932 isoform X2 [Harpegnathos saltator]|uniref:uncharacterized protein LOC109503932 isoform X2 n=1 Tax=Harpegnathos saltator TaxID=610380 RepID=UPI000DBEE378|nr:uncharacterized protein LOC109503932 isoform X2 [Harpegnathos saltator]
MTLLRDYRRLVGLWLSFEMVFPEERYYRLNRILLSVTGLWPYDDNKVRQVRFILLLLIIMLITSPQLLKLFISEYKLDTFLKVLSLDMIMIIITIKYITFYAIVDNVKIFRQYISESWSNLTDEREIQIIYKQGKAGKISTIVLATLVYFMLLFCIFTQYVPNLFDIIKPLNVSRPCRYFILAEYFIDQQKYFHIIAMNINIGLFTLGTILLATETFALANALYAFGLFKIASYRMKYILNGNHLQISATKKYVASRDKIIAAVDMHRRAIHFGPTYLILFMGVIFSTSINMFYLFRIITTKQNMLEIIEHSLLIVLHIISLIAANYAGQQFINCDSHVHRTICNTQWYNAPLKTQKLILFLIQKTTKCYKVDAGGMFSPSLEGLATGLSMSASYFMVFCSM